MVKKGKKEKPKRMMIHAWFYTKLLKFLHLKIFVLYKLNDSWQVAQNKSNTSANSEMICHDNFILLKQKQNCIKSFQAYKRSTT